jgi:hypothetical protein
MPRDEGKKVRERREDAEESIKDLSGRELSSEEQEAVKGGRAKPIRTGRKLN